MSPLKAGEKLANFGGRIIRAEDEVGDYGIQIDETFVINGLDAETEESDDCFFCNHSCDPISA